MPFLKVVITIGLAIYIIATLAMTTVKGRFEELPLIPVILAGGMSVDIQSTPNEVVEAVYWKNKKLHKTANIRTYEIHPCNKTFSLPRFTLLLPETELSFTIVTNKTTHKHVSTAKLQDNYDECIGYDGGTFRYISIQLPDNKTQSK